MNIGSNSKIKGSVKSKIAIALIPITIVVYVLVCLLTLQQTGKELKKTLNTEIELTTKVVDGKIQSSIGRTIGIMDNVKTSIENGDTDTKSIQEYLYTVADAYPETIPTGIYCGLEDGTYIDKMWTPDDPEWIMKERPWYIEGLAADQVTFGEAYMDEMTGSYIVSIYANLKDKSGKTIGVISADIPIDDIATILEEQSILDTGYIYAIDTYSGMIFGNCSNPELNGCFISDNTDELSKIISKDIESGSLESVKKYGDIYYNLQKIKGTNFITVAIVPVSNINSILTRIGLKAFGTSIIGMVFQIVLISLLLGFLLKPLKSISNSINQMHNLDLTSKAEIKANDEFGRISMQLNDLSSNLRNVMSAFQNSTENLLLSADGNMSSANSISEASDKQKIAMEQLTEIMGELSKAIEIIADGSTKLAANVSDVSDEIGIAEDKVKSASSCAIMGATEIEKMQNNIFSVSEVSEELCNSINDMKDGLKGINEMVTMIKDIADQTNLLSLNASIEAARAGEAGRGFAVVASEIRTLSDSCQKSVISIVDTTEKLDNLVDIVSKNAQKNITIIAESKENSTNVNKAFESIRNEINEINHVTEKIGASVKEVDAVASDMAAITQEQTASTEVVLNTCHEVAEISNSVFQKSEDLVSSGSSLKNLANDLTKQIEKFII